MWLPSPELDRVCVYRVQPVRGRIVNDSIGDCRRAFRPTRTRPTFGCSIEQCSRLPVERDECPVLSITGVDDITNHNWNAPVGNQPVFVVNPVDFRRRIACISERAPPLVAGFGVEGE